LIRKTDFTKKILAVVIKIPKGQMMTYGQVAALAGKPLAVRVVGMIMSKNYNLEVPCHRVVRADGGIGGYNRGGVEMKAKLLQDEQVC
jgi:methylated-DNA-[protein]-cysteine S-methyltransferase